MASIVMRDDSHITAVDLFCGAAGLSLGLKQSGVHIAAGIDLDPACEFPFSRNIGAPFLRADISTVDPQAINAMFGEARIRLLAGCAPCQPFSGYTARRRTVDCRWSLLLDFLRIALEIRPELVTLENVPRLVHLPLWTEFVTTLAKSGYKVAWKVLDAADYGVPQTRKRVVLCASLLGEVNLPTPTEKQKTVRSAIGSLPHIDAGRRGTNDTLHSARTLTPVNLARIRASRQGGTWRDWPNEMKVNCHRKEQGRTYPSVYGRMSWEKPSPTITTQFYGFGNGRFGHPEQDRAITLREGAILQSFPADFAFAPEGRKINFREIGRLIGNAVPPALGLAIGRAFVAHVRDACRH